MSADSGNRPQLRPRGIKRAEPAEKEETPRRAPAKRRRGELAQPEDGTAAARDERVKPCSGSGGEGPEPAAVGAGGQLGALPRDVLELVLAGLGPVDLCRSASVCRLWRSAADSDVLWRPLVESGSAASAADGRTEGVYKGRYESLVHRWRSRQPGWTSTLRDEPHGGKAGRSVLFDPARSVVFSGGQDSTVQVREYVRASDPRLSFTHVGGRGSVNSLQLVDRSRQLLLVGRSSPESGASLWRLDPQTGGPGAEGGLDACAAYSGHSDSVFCARADLSVGRVATGGGQNDNTALVFDAETCRVLHRLQHKGSVRGLCFGENPAAQLWTASLDKRLRLFDARTGAAETELVAHQSGLHAVQAEGHVIATSCGRPNNEAALWDARQLQRGPRTVLSGHRSAVSCLRFDSLRLATGSYDGSVRAWDLSTGAQLWMCALEAPVHAVDVAGSVLVAAGDGGLLHLMDFSLS